MESDEEITPLKRRRKGGAKNKRTPCKQKLQQMASQTNNDTSDSDTNNISSTKKSDKLKSEKNVQKSPNKNKNHEMVETHIKVENSTTFTGLFSSTNNKADMQYFKPRSTDYPSKERTIFCPVCSINLVFLHGSTPQAHINDCLDKYPDFEKGYCSGDSSCSLSNVQHFRAFKHEHKLQNHTTDTDSVVSSSEEKAYPETADGETKILCASNVAQGVQQKNGDGLNKTTSPKKQTSINDFFGGKKLTVKSQVKTPSRNNGKSSANVSPQKSANKNTGRKPRNVRKECPFYKKIPGTNFTVDAFRYGDISGCTGYFLTHFHSDHYGGLTKSFNKKLYCSQITANLVQCQIKVSSEYIHVLPMEQTTDVEGVKITLLDANHCPGAVMFLMELPSRKRILHVGDFRADPSMVASPYVSCKPMDTLYLDTTYCDPRHTFPPQDKVIEFVVETTRKYLKENPKTLIACGTYSVGKEKVFRAIADDQDFKIGVSKSKMALLKCLGDEELEKRLTLDLNQANLHVLPMGSLSIKALQEYLYKHKKNGYERILTFKPTGWTFSDKLTSFRDIAPIRRPNITIYGVPYSEHSSFEEMKSFVVSLKPKQIIPTVNIGRIESRDQMNEYFKAWLKS